MSSTAVNVFTFATTEPRLHPDRAGDDSAAPAPPRPRTILGRASQRVDSYRFQSSNIRAY
jgi:hypothetical protein